MPPTLHGYSTHFGAPNAEGARLLATTAGPVNHRVALTAGRVYVDAMGELTAVRFFHDRPFRVADAGRFVQPLKAAIKDPVIETTLTDAGSIDQFSHSTDLRSYPRLQVLYKA